MTASDSTIPNLPSAGTITGTEYVPIDQSGTTVKSTLSALFGRGTLQSLTYAATIPWAATSGNMITVTLTGNATLSLPTGIAPGYYTAIIKQDAVGGHTLAFASGYVWVEGGVPVVSPGANAVTVLSFISDGISMYGLRPQEVVSMAALRACSGALSEYVEVRSYYLGGTTGGGKWQAKPSDTTSGWYGTASVSGNTVTIVSTTNGSPAVGQQFNYPGSDGSRYLTAGSGLSWTISGAPLTLTTQVCTGDDGGSVIVALDGMRWYRQWITYPSITDFGATPDYNPITRTGTDNRYACQNAINYASAIYSTSADYSQNIAKKLTAPNGIFLIGGSGLDLTTSRVANTYTRDGLVFEGASFSTVFVGQTGNLAVMDVTGSQWLQLSKFWIYARDGDANSSTVGVFDGIATANPQSQNKLFNIRIALGTSTTANGGLGTVAFWGFGSEENTHAQPYYTAIRAALFTTDNSGTAHPAYPQGTAYPYSALMSSHSMGLVTIVGESFLQSSATTGTIAPLALYNANTIKASNLYLNSQSTSAGVAAIDVPYGALTNSVIHGTVEGCGTGLRISALVDSSEISLTYGGVNAAAQNSDPAIALVHGTQGTIQNSKLVVNLLANTTRPVWGIGSAPATGTPISCKLMNVRCFANGTTIGEWMPPSNLLYNSGNVELSGLKGTLPVSYRLIGNNVHEINISSIVTYSPVGPIYNVPILQLALPPVIAGNSLAGYAIKIEGTFESGYSNGTNSVVTWVTGWASFAINPNGTHVTPVVSGSLTNKAAANTAANDISGITVVAVDNTTYFNLILNPVMGGSAAETTYFQGTATLVWKGHVSDAPYMALP